jgi:hypothetical protein
MTMKGCEHPLACGITDGKEMIGTKNGKARKVGQYLFHKIIVVR